MAEKEVSIKEKKIALIKNIIANYRESEDIISKVVSLFNDKMSFM